MSTPRQYEFVYIVTPEASEAQLGELHGQVVGIAERFGGTIDATENWGRRKLAYEIGRHKEGVYVLETLSGPPDMMKELDRRFKVIDPIIRHLIVRVDEELRVAERTRARRKEQAASRRIARGLPPEPETKEPPAAAEAGQPAEAEG